MSSTWFAAVLAFAAGLGGAIQIAAQGRLGDRVGSLEAVTTAALSEASSRSQPFSSYVALRVGEAVAGPKSQLLGGAMSVFIILAITVAGLRIGIIATTPFLIAAQFRLATAIDRYGWFGVEHVALTWPRVLGVGPLVVGAAVTLRR
jgi:transporter family-2 protein